MIKIILAIAINISDHTALTLSRWMPLSYRNQSIDLRSKSIDWFLYDNGLRLERVKAILLVICKF